MASTQIPVTITYHRPGTHPPLYIAGTFSNPPWQPYEMDHTTREDGEYNFRKEVHAEPGSKIQYKFRMGDGDWWVLKDDGPTVTDSSGNTNHVLEVKSEEEMSHGQNTDRRGPQGTQGVDNHGGSDRPLSYAKVASKRLQPSSGQSSTDRSATGTPITAKVAAEVADSAELLHEEVPEREKSDAGVAKQTDRRMSEEAETAADVADSAQALDSRQSTIVILEPPPGEGSPFTVQPRGDETPEDQDGYIADKSPLFAHECVGMYESDGELGEQEEGEGDLHTTGVEDFGSQIEPEQADLDDPTLERFPSSRDDIMDAVRKLESGLPADHASFDGKRYSPVINPSRRGTEDITGDFSLFPPQPSAPSTQRPPKKSPRGSITSLNATASLHSISEGDEPGEEPSAEEEESIFRPAVVFSNPLKAKPKHLKLPTGDEDEGIALREGVSPRTVKPAGPPFRTSEASPAHSPPSPKSARKGGQPHDETDNLASAEAELHKDKARSLEEVKIHPAPPSDPGHSHPGNPQARVPKPGEDNAEHSGGPINVSAESSTDKDTAKRKAVLVPRQSSDSKTTAPDSGPRRPSYAEVAASKPSSTDDKGRDKSKTTTPPTAESSTSATTTSRDTDSAKDQSETADIRMRGGEGGEQLAAATGDNNLPVVQLRKGGGWIKAIFRLVFVDFIGGIVKRVLRMFRMGWVLAMLGVERGRGR